MCHIDTSEDIMKRNILDNKKLKENPFRTPVGYFQDVQQKLMEALPDNHNVVPVRPLVYRKFVRVALATAASVCIAVFGAVAYMHHLDAGKTEGAPYVQTSHFSDDDATYYIQMDNSDIYNYIAEL